jgi:C-terminal processing protease CtpA/Prc
MADALRAALKEGDYDSIDKDRELARRLTDDLRAISHDRHLGVRPAPPPASGEPRIGVPDGEARGNYAFRKAEVLGGNVGYIRLDGFVPGPEAERTAAAAMAFVAHCDALIFDLRQNGGGDPEMIRFLTSYLFDEPTHLNDMVDRDGKVVEEYWTLEDVPGERFGPKVPVFVLTSSYTFSGGEEFTYNLKNLKRATIVGETTGGGAHPVRGERVNDCFMVGVPYMRARNPISGTNWEGVGVEPDVAVPADEALDRALDLAHTPG